VYIVYGFLLIVVVGVGVSISFLNFKSLKITDNCLIKVKIIHICVGIAFVIPLDRYLQPPVLLHPFAHYVFQFIKYAILPNLVINDIPMITGVSKVHFF